MSYHAWFSFSFGPGNGEQCSITSFHNFIFHFFFCWWLIISVNYYVWQIYMWFKHSVHFEGWWWLLFTLAYFICIYFHILSYSYFLSVPFWYTCHAIIIILPDHWQCLKWEVTGWTVLDHCIEDGYESWKGLEYWTV